MIIEKNGKCYEIVEKSNCWAVTTKTGALSVTVEVDKKICKTESELKNYIYKEEIF